MNPSRLFQSLAVVIILTAGVPAVFAAKSSQSQSTVVDVNSASEKDLEALPGIGAATAKKIIAGRPYSSVGDLSRAGVSASTMDKIRGMVTAGRSSSQAMPPLRRGDTSRTTPSRPLPNSSGGLVDLNTAAQKELEALPGVGAVTARKIIASRPYSSVSDLSRAGVSAATMDKIRGMVVAGRSSPQTMPTPGRSDASPSTRSNRVPDTSGAPVDLNTASQKDLEKLPAIGFFTARKIIAGRPYNSVDDLSRAGVSASAIAKIRGLVAVSAPPRTTRSLPRDSTPRPLPSQRDDRVPPAGEPRQTAPPQTAGDRGEPERESQRSTSVAPRAGSGMVWVNKDTKVFHREGDHWYGNTVHGAYMTEQDAVNAGYRESKQKVKPQ